VTSKDPLQSFRQPLVTATGLLLGFSLGFAATWVHTDNPLGIVQALVVGACLLCGTVAQITTLFRILDHRYPRDDADAYYARTLRLFIAGVCVTFAGVFFDLAISMAASSG
jgi:hypothetical protein